MAAKRKKINNLEGTIFEDLIGCEVSFLVDNFKPYSSVKEICQCNEGH